MSVRLLFWCIVASIISFSGFGVGIQMFAASKPVDMDGLKVLNTENSNLAIEDNSNDTNEFTFGACRPGNESCQNCYLTLVKSLLGNDENIVNLLYTFTSPIHDEPNLAIVKYHFSNNDGTKNSTAIWFWAKSGAYFLHPLSVFQFISLFFGNPRPIYEVEVDLHLDANECYGVQSNSIYMTLLTQRVSRSIIIIKICNC